MAVFIQYTLFPGAKSTVRADVDDDEHVEPKVRRAILEGTCHFRQHFLGGHKAKEAYFLCQR